MTKPNKDRARRLLATVKGSVYEQTKRNRYLAVCDLLTDLRHLCEASGLDFGKIDRQAYEHYREERLEK